MFTVDTSDKNRLPVPACMRAGLESCPAVCLLSLLTFSMAFSPGASDTGLSYPASSSLQLDALDMSPSYAPIQ